jgi:hypothetical protein
MATTLERNPVYSLWSSNGNGWNLLDTNYDQAALHRQARSLKAVFTTKNFLVKAGTDRP